MKILLVSSCFEEVSLITATKDNTVGQKTTDETHYPIGLAYIYSYLESYGHQLELLHLNNYSTEQCFEKVKQLFVEFNPELVGFQILTANRVSSFQLIDYIHENYPDIIQVCGGIHTTTMHEQILNRYPYVVTVLGEGEITFAELVNRLKSADCDLESIAGIAFNRDGKIVKTKPRGLISNLDELPFPKHELFFDNDRRCGCILTARGCPFACSFCCLDQISQRKVRLRSVENVISEVEHMVAKFPKMTKLWIHDDTFFIDNERVIRFCDEVIKRNIKLEFICSGRAKPLSSQLVQKLVEANFKIVMLGLESGDDSILKACHKGITQKDITQAFQLFAGTPIDLRIFLIVGLPGETLETVQETIRFVKELQKIKYTNLEGASILTVYPGTEIYNIANSMGVINDDFWLSNETTPAFTVENRLEELFIFQELINNNLCLNKLFSIKGLLAQYKMMPYAARYVYGKESNIFSIIDRVLFNLLPGTVHSFIKKTFRLIKK